MRRVLIALVVALPALLAPITPASAAASTTPPIQHLVVIVEQNSTYDHVFGDLPLSKNLPTGRRPTQTQVDATSNLRMGPSSQLTPIDFNVAPGESLLSNGATAAETAFDGGAMDGFVEAQDKAGRNADISFSVLDHETHSPWRRLASQGVVFDRYFSSTLAGSLPNTLNLVAGTSGGIVDSSRASLKELWNRPDINSIFEAAQGTDDVSWKYYVGGLGQLDPTKLAEGTYIHSGGPIPSQLYWAPILAMHDTWTNLGFSDNIRPQNDFFQAAATGTLPNITYVVPQPSTHEPLPLSADLRLLSLVNAVRSSPDWSSTALMIVWDDWGGYYDHLTPPEAADGQQLGFRVPMILISPYADAHTINSHVLDHSSIPELAASLFHLQDGYQTRSRTTFPVGLWTDAPSGEDRFTALSHPDRYRALGMEHAPSVFILYLLTVVMITGVLFVTGVTLRRAPDDGGNRF
jgi:phospholipase C